MQGYGGVQAEGQHGVNGMDSKKLKGFAEQTVLIAGENVDHEAANDQEVRADELRELVRLG